MCVCVCLQILSNTEFTHVGLGFIVRGQGAFEVALSLINVQSFGFLCVMLARLGFWLRVSRRQGPNPAYHGKLKASTGSQDLGGGRHWNWGTSV